MGRTKRATPGKSVACALVVALILVGLLLASCGEPEQASTTITQAQASTTVTQGEPQKVYELTYALFQPDGAALSAVNREFAKEIESRTNGRVKITVHGGGSLLGAPAMYQGVLDGVADMGNGVTSYDPGAFPFTSVAELPSKAQSGWAVSNAQYDFLQQYHPEEWSQVHVLTACGDAANCLAVYTAKKQIKTMADLKGVSIRTNQPDAVQALGATVKDIPMADVYDALSKGVLDGVMGAPEPLKTWKLAEVCNFVTLDLLPGQPSIMWYNIMNKKTWDSLPSDIQQIITDVSKEYSAKLGLTWDDQSVAGIEYSLSLGKTVYVLPDDEAQKWAEALLSIIDKRLETVAKERGMSLDDLKAAWQYFEQRVEYWNGQQAGNNVAPVAERIRRVLVK